MTAESAAAHLAAVLVFDEIYKLARAALIHSDTHPEVRHHVVRGILDRHRDELEAEARGEPGG